MSDVATFGRHRRAPSEVTVVEKLREGDLLDASCKAAPGLLWLQEQIVRDAALTASGVVVPERLRPDDAAGQATMLGLPVTWGDRFALIYSPDEPRR